MISLKSKCDLLSDGIHPDTSAASLFWATFIHCCVTVILNACWGLLTVFFDRMNGLHDWLVEKLLTNEYFLFPQLQTKIFASDDNFCHPLDGST